MSAATRRSTTSGRLGAPLAALILLLAPAAAPAFGVQPRTIRFDRISIEQGLSQSAVLAIHQDRDGWMWFGTEDGLNRYDGYEFRVYKHEPRNPRSLSNAGIWTIFEDRDGRIWVGTDGGGLCLWDPVGDDFRTWRHDPDDPTSLGSDVVRAIAQTADGALWIATDGGGLARMDPEEESFRRYAHDPEEPGSLASDRVRALLVDRAGRLWIGTQGGGLDRFDPDRNSFAHHRHDPANPASLSDDEVYDLSEDRLGRIWIGTYNGGLNRLDTATSGFVRYPAREGDPTSLAGNRVSSIVEDVDGTIWVGTDAGLTEWVPDTDAFLRYANRGTDPRSLSHDKVTSLFVDAGGVMWVGTKAGGLNKWNPRTAAFRHVQRDPENPASLSSNMVTSFQKAADGTLYIGTFGGGLNVMDTEAGTVRHLRAGESGLGGDGVMALKLDRSGILWIGTYRKGLRRYDPRTGAFRGFEHDPADPTSLGARGVMSIHEDRQGTLWVGSFGGGLNRLDRESGTFERFVHDPDDPRSLGGDRVTAMVEDLRGNFWIGTDGGGLNRFDAAAGAFERIAPEANDGVAVDLDDILALYVDPNDTLWIATQGAGLHRWRAADRYAGKPAFRVYTEEDGLPNNLIYGILRDDRGYLWLSTNKGLSRFHPGNESFTNYDTRRGLQSNEFNFGAHYRSPDGELYFGGINGFNVLEPGETLDNPYRPPVVLTKLFRLDHERQSETPLSRLDELVLHHRESVVWIEFAALDYTAPESNRYAYKLEGFDADWIDLGTMRRATFTNLDPGQYTLHLRGSNSDGVWSEEERALKVRVLPPPWKTWWAYTGYVLIAAGALMLYSRAQARRLHEEEEHSRKLELEVQARTRELASRNEQLKSLNARLEDASLTDPLTGLRNRRYLVTRIKDDIAATERRMTLERRAASSDGVPEFSFLMVDVDGLKRVNDLFGHQAGDRAILQICSLLQSICRQTDTIIRWGGDEFMVVARHLDPASAEVMAERIRVAVSKEPIAVGDGRQASLSCSVGLAHFPFLPAQPMHVSWEQVIAIADRALYIAKTSGRNAWAAILGTSETPADGLLERIADETEALVRRGLIRFHTSIRDRTRLVWSRAS